MTTYTYHCLMADVINGVTYCDADHVDESGDNFFVEWDFYNALKDTDKPIYGLVSGSLLDRIKQEYGVQ